MIMDESVTPLTHASLFELLSARVDDSAKLKDIPAPALLKGATKAANRIADAITHGEKIAFVGDYDVDGVSSSAIVVLFFRLINVPLEFTIPNRFTDGYGVSKKIIERLDADVIFTADNGINANEAADVAKERGIDLIITDHHTPSEVLPDAYCIVNPKLSDCPYPFKEICGAEVIWLVLAELKRVMSLSIDMAQFLDILAIAVVADVMPLVQFNRAIVKRGLQRIARKQRPCTQVIMEQLKKSSITAEDIAFQIAPRVNSAGRMEDAAIALHFFTAPTYSEAFAAYELLSELNTLRKETEAMVTQEAMAQVNEADKIIVVAKEHWHEGVVGIVASRLVDRYKRPAIVLSIQDGIAKGSARSIGAVNIYSLIASQSNTIIKFGGHMMAAGMAMHEGAVETFTHGINQAAALLDESLFIEKEQILGELPLEEVNSELLSVLEQFEPYGEANPKPLFYCSNAKVQQCELMGQQKNHTRVTLQATPVSLLVFREALTLQCNDLLRFTYHVNKNEFNGHVTTQMNLQARY